MGLVYLLGGLFALRQAGMNWALDASVARITLEPTPARERIAATAMVAAAGLTLASGAALALLSGAAIWLFGACWATQAAYLLWAQRGYAPEDESDRRGRRRTINAFALYSLATAWVLWLGGSGRLA